MISLRILLPVCLAILFAVASSAGAAENVQVLPASLVASTQVNGRLVVLNDRLVFIDDERPASSFEASKTAIQQLTLDGETATLQLSKSVRDRSGDTNRLIFKLSTAADAATLQRWSGAAETSTATPPNSATTLEFSADRKKRFASNPTGKLIVDNERLMFESVDSSKDSRRWELKEIREIKLRNPFELEIQPSRGAKYVLRLGGRGMDNAEYREIVDRVTRARTER
jgi:hypothetical protein